MYTAMELAKYIVSKCYYDGCPISNLQLQKILYYIQKEFLKETATPAFRDDIEAWQFGPVVPNVYYHFCGFGAMRIFIAQKNEKCPLNYDDVQMINAIIEEKRVLDPWQLVEDTHKSGGAWDKIYQGGLGNHQVIPVELIRQVG